MKHGILEKFNNSFTASLTLDYSRCFKLIISEEFNTFLDSSGHVIKHQRMEPDVEHHFCQTNQETFLEEIILLIIKDALN